MLNFKKYTIAIIGAGYLGQTTAAVLAAAGHKVFCLDIKPEIVQSLNRGKPTFFEPGLEQVLSIAHKKKNLIATLDYTEAISKSDISFICVDTPASKSGELSLKSVMKVARSMAQVMPENHLIVMKSTVPIRTSEKFIKFLSAKTKKKFRYASNPEFLAEGYSVLSTMLPDHIVIGASDAKSYDQIFKTFELVDYFAKKTVNGEHPSDDKISKKLLLTYAQVNRSRFNYDKPYAERVIKVSVPSAELVKVTANAFLTTKISFANSIANICDRSGADIMEVAGAAGADPRIGMDYFYAGLGWGGGCFPKDALGLVTQSKKLGYDFSILREVISTNRKQADLAYSKARRMLGRTANKSDIAVLGLAFKPGTSDTRVSPAINLVKRLVRGVQSIRVFDPQAMENTRRELGHIKKISFANSAIEAAKDSELVILATEWPEFLNLDFKELKRVMSKPKLLDCRNVWNKDYLKSLGFEYVGIGR